MSKPVEFDDVERRIAEFGERANLITVTSEGRPHVVSAVILVAGDRLVSRIGSRTRGNLAAREQLTLTWLPAADGEYQLILDGVAELLGDPDGQGVSEVTIRVERGILHRLADQPTQGPGCMAL